MSARSRLLPARIRDERGFGMVELLAAMTVMLVGVLAVFSLFQAGIIQIRRASTVTTAAALADAEMEKFRAYK
jgi:prepilin-type N-terminal cleavage/methylation domain-containing protein